MSIGGSDQVDFDLLPEFQRNLEIMALSKSEKVLIAVSGGPDSMALLHLFSRWNPKMLGVFHLNHGFRDSATAEANFVRDYVKKKGISVEIVNYDVERYLITSGESKQQGARKIRYELLLNYAKKHGFNRIALGHHGDDQAETVLMRIVRGSGLLGISGIPMERGLFIRPLLSIYKSEIEQYCKAFRVPYVEDESNFEPIYLRNKIRQELLPTLVREYNPEIKTQLIQLAKLARADELELQRQTEEICHEYVSKMGEQVLFPRSVFSKLSTAMQRRVLRALIYRYQGHLLRIGFSHIEEWRRQLYENTTFHLSLPQVVVSANQKLIYVGESPSVKLDRTVLSVPGEISLGNMLIKSEILSADELEPQPKDSEDFDMDLLSLPLFVRSRKKGDRFSSFGLGGSKKVKDLLIDEKIPIDQRDSLPLVCDQMGIIWIPSVRRSSFAPISSKTVSVVRLSFFK